MQSRKRVMKINGNHVTDQTKVDFDVKAVKNILTTHEFIKIFDNFIQENIIKGRSTALEKFIKHKNL